MQVNVIPTLESAIRGHSNEIADSLNTFFFANLRGRQGMLREAREQWAIVRKGRGFAPISSAWITLPEGQHKLGMSDEVYNTGQTLQSATADGTYNACPWSGECVAVCVLKGGNGAYPRVQLARSAKNDFWASHPTLAAILWAEDIRKADEKAARLDKTHLHRPNVNSDVRWERILPAEFFDGTWFPNTVFNDYSKNPAVLSGNGWVSPRYRKTYSISENTNMARIAPFLARGGSVTVVTNRKKGTPISPIALWLLIGSVAGDLPPTVNGDIDDNRYSDPAGAIVDLTAKGRARKNPGTFVRNIY